MIEKLHLKNFTAFTDLEIDFSPKINVIVGENGTGKTHLLKAAYALCSRPNNVDAVEHLSSKLLRIFQPIEEKLGKLRRHGSAENANISAQFDSGQKLEVNFHTNSKRAVISGMFDYMQESGEPIFIPTKEVLSLVHGMHHPDHDEQTVEWIFDGTYTDLSKRLLKEATEDATIEKDPRLAAIIPKLVDLIRGRYHLEDGKFCFEAGEYIDKKDPNRSAAKHAQMYQDSTILKFKPTGDARYSSSMTAEGFKKIGVLHRLLSNGQLAPGVSGPLFWDEPESNLNPKLMRQIVEILLELARNGQQVIIATHDYVFLKWFDILMDKDEGDHVRFHSLHRDNDTQNVSVKSTNNYRDIQNNPIAETFNELTIEHAKSQLRDIHK